MFMFVLARPLFADYGDILFDGKIGIFSLLKYQHKERARIEMQRQ